MPPKLLLLHRYYLWAYRMRRELAALGTRPIETEQQTLYRVREVMFTGMWLAHLQVTVEGWSKLKLKDSAVDALLARDDQTRTLRQLRNSLFHFDLKNSEHDNLSLPGVTPELLSWAGQLHDAIGDWFMALDTQRPIH